MDLTSPWAKTLATAALICALNGCEPKSGPTTATPSTPNTEPAPAPAPVLTKSAEPNSFDEVAAQLDRGGTFYLYLSTQSWLAGLSQQLAPLRAALAPPPSAPKTEQENFARTYDMVVDLFRQSGIEELTGVGASSIATGTGTYRHKFFAHHAPGKGDGFLWTLFGRAPHRLDTLQMLPPQTALAYFLDIDPSNFVSAIGGAVQRSNNPELKKAYDQAMAALSAGTGIPTDAALQSLSGTAGIVITLDPATQVQVPAGAAALTSPKPGLALLLPAKDDRIFEQLEKLMSATPGMTKVDEPGLKLRSMAEMPLSPEFKLRPTLARWGNYLILASDDGLIRSMIAAQKDGKGVTSTPEFAKLSAGLPTEGNGFELMTTLFSDTLVKLQGEMTKNAPAMPPQQAAMMKGVFDQNGGASAYAVYTHLPNGWLTAANSVQARPSSAGAYLAAMLGAIAVPAVEAASDRAKATQSTSRARQIGIACQAYAAQHKGKFPPALKDLFPEFIQDPNALKSPFAPNEAEGYKYTPGLGTSSDPATVLVEDAHADSAGHRVILRVDGSVEERKKE